MWLDQEHLFPAPLFVSFPIFGVQKRRTGRGLGLGLRVSLPAEVGKEGPPHHLSLGPLP